MKRLPGTAAIVLASATLLALTGAAHAVDHGKAASDYGFANASLELYCKGILTVADAKEKAKLDRMYRNNSRWKKDYAEGYDYIANRERRDMSSLWSICVDAASRHKWLRIDSEVRVILQDYANGKLKENEAQEQLNQKNAALLAVPATEEASDVESTKISLAIRIALYESVCEIKLSPAVEQAKELLLKNVGKKIVMVGSAAIIGSWNGDKAAMAKWCAGAPKTLRMIEEGMKP
jgi:hypothetical protein